MPAYHVAAQIVAHHLSTALALSSNRLLWLDIAVPVEWVAQPGQYVQLWMPRLGARSPLQLPAFYVASVDQCTMLQEHLPLAFTHSDPTPTGRDWKDYTSCGSCHVLDGSFSGLRAGSVWAST